MSIDRSGGSEGVKIRYQKPMRQIRSNVRETPLRRNIEVVRLSTSALAIVRVQGYRDIFRTPGVACLTGGLTAPLGRTMDNVMSLCARTNAR